MKYTTPLLLAALLCVSAVCGRPIQKRDSSTGIFIAYGEENVTLSNEHTYTFFDTSLEGYGFAGADFLMYMGVEGSIEGTSQAGDAEADGALGVIVADSVDPLSIIEMFFHEKANWQDAGASQPSDLDVSGSASFVAMIYEKIDEVDAGGNVVHTINFKDITFSLTAVQHDDAPDAPDALSYATLYGSSGSATISVAVVVSDVIGSLNVGADITPQSLETVLQISGYTYANAANHLRLTVIAGTGSFSGEVDVSNGEFVSWGSGASAPYVTLCQTVDAGSDADSATSTGVTLSNWADFNEDNLPSSIIASYAKSLEEEGIPMKFVSATVDFPAGQAYLQYDPQTGFNRPNSGAAAALVPGLAILLSALAAFLKF